MGRKSKRNEMRGSVVKEILSTSIYLLIVLAVTYLIIYYVGQRTEVEGSSIKVPVHSRVAIVCSLKEFYETGDHYLYICDVEQVYGNEAEEALFAWNGYSQVRPAK